MQFLITAHTNISDGQAIRPDRMGLYASIHAANIDDYCDGIAYLNGNRHWINEE